MIGKHVAAPGFYLGSAIAGLQCDLESSPKSCMDATWDDLESFQAVLRADSLPDWLHLA